MLCKEGLQGNSHQRYHWLSTQPVQWVTVVKSAGKEPRQQFKESRIPGSRFFDLDAICDKSSDLPHMLPSAEAFAAAADELGISNTDTVVLYDRSGIFSAPRAWWTFKVFGHDR